MPSGTVTAKIPASCHDVFRLLHDDSRRLEWNTSLREAKLCENWDIAQIHATTVCTGRWYLGRISFQTKYVSFNSPTAAAVKTLNRQPYFDSFAATIRHRSLANGSFSVAYK